MSERMSLWGVVSGTGKPLVKAQMCRILTNKAYLGIIGHKEESYEGIFPALVYLKTFEAVQQLLKKRTRPRKSKKKHDFPFTGLLTCGRV